MITIHGRIISKKRQYKRKKGGGLYLSQRWKNFEERVVYEDLQGAHKHKSNAKLCIEYRFKVKGKYNVDIDNMIVSVNDLLQTARVIKDDKLITEGSFKKTGGHKKWKTEIRIFELIDHSLIYE